MEDAAFRLLAEGGTAGALIWIAWRISERLGALAEAFAGCAARMDTLIAMMKRSE